jgi:prepilin-type N-terminal cleavage/methylation domain-containing protein
VNTKKSGLTMIEILVVLSIIALLAGILLPAVHTVQKMARDTKQRAQFTAIELGLATFKNDYGDYPRSDWWKPVVDPALDMRYCGAQKLAEALVGYDLLGFHPDSTWKAGVDELTPPPVYTAGTLDQRKSRYIDLDTANVFKLGRTALSDGLFVNTGDLAPFTYVLCDVFGVNERKVILPSGKVVSPGTPILYYKANPASKLFPEVNLLTRTVVPPPPAALESYVYNARDDWPLLSLGKLANVGRAVDPATNVHPLENFTNFYTYIWDQRVPPIPTGTGAAMGWPHRPDSYILISAGADGVYGTNDDIRSFGQ